MFSFNSVLSFIPFLCRYVGKNVSASYTHITYARKTNTTLAVINDAIAKFDPGTTKFF